MDRLEVTYTDENRVELGMIDSYSLDLAYGSDENEFDLTVPIDFTLPRKSLVYIDGTEWGGVVRGCRISTLGEEPTSTITGQTWHGVLAESCIIPDAGSDHYRSSGEANAAIRAILARQGLDDLFDASGEDSGIMVEHEHDRFADAYASIRKMLRKSGAKLKIAKEPGRKPTLYAVEIGSYVDDGSAGRLAYEMRDDMPYNHIIGLGNGEMQDRAVVHLYADADGVVSETQTLFGLDERQYVYELSNNDEDNLREEGKKKLEELQSTDSVDLRLPDDESYDVGDIVGVVNDDTGVSVMADVAKVIVKVDENGNLSVSNEVGEVKSSGSMQGGYSSGSTGLAYKGGPGIGIVGAVISADVTEEKLAAVEAKADSAGKVAAAAVKRVKGSAPIVTEESGGTVSVSHAASGVAGGSYGPASDSSPSWGDTVTVGSRLVIDGAGHIKDAAGRKLVLPSSTATQSAKGLMSAADKQRVDAYPWDAIIGKPATFAPAAHSHDDRYYTEAEMNTKLAGKSDASHVHAWDAITGKPASFPAASHTHDDRYYTETEINTKLAGKSDTAHTHAWSGITGKPASYPPSTHNHDAAYAAKSHTHQWADVTGKPASFPPSAHTHAWADVSGKPTSFTPSAHAHDWTSITGKPASFPPSSHSHDWSALTGKPASFPPSSHSHSVATASAAGFMSPDDKKAIDALKTGAVTGVKGNAEAAYRTGNVNLTAANVGALPTAGGTLDAAAQVKRVGRSMSWMNGRDGALIRQTSYTGYNPMWSAKTTNGSWEMGPYTNNNLYLNYITDASYNAGSNSPTAQIVFGPDGSVSAPGLTVAGKTLLDRTYPVGAVYLSFSATSPASLFGGTWAQITGRFLRAANDTGTGGSDAHTLTAAQMPGHHHGVIREQDGDWAGYWQSNASGGGLWWIVSNGTPGANRGLKTTSVGSGQSHNNMPAYQDVYAWRRTA